MATPQAPHKKTSRRPTQQRGDTSLPFTLFNPKLKDERVDTDRISRRASELQSLQGTLLAFYLCLSGAGFVVNGTRRRRVFSFASSQPIHFSLFS